MFTFTQIINSYNGEQGFSVTYRPDDTRLTAISLWIKLPPLSDSTEILRQLTNAAPQHIWQQQIDALTIDASVYQSLIGTELKVEQKTISTSTSNVFDPKTIEQIKSKIV